MKRVTHTGDNLAKALLLTAILFYAPLAYSCLGENLPELVDASGSGTQKDPFLIGSFESLACMGRGGYLYATRGRVYQDKMANGVNCSSKERWDFNAHYKLIKNIDASRTRSLPQGWESIIGKRPPSHPHSLPYWQFKGSIDGNYYKITGLFINDPTKQLKALISDLGRGGSIKNLGLEGVNFTGLEGIAGLVAVMHDGAISNSYVTGELTVAGTPGAFGTNARANGGLVGMLSKGAIRNSYADVNLSRNWGTSTSGDAPPTGGLVGQLFGVIQKSYAKGRIKGPCTNNICSASGDYGGLVGEMNHGGSIARSYAAVSFVQVKPLPALAIAYVGGLLGFTNGGKGFGDNYFTTGSASKGVGHVATGGTDFGTARPADQINELDMGGTAGTAAKVRSWDSSIWGNLGTGSAFPCLRRLTPGCNLPLFLK